MSCSCHKILEEHMWWDHDGDETEVDSELAGMMRRADIIEENKGQDHA